MTNVANWVEEDTQTTGTGAITLGTDPIAGSTTWAQAFGTGITAVWYSLASGNNRETGIGSFNGTTNVLTRTTPISTLVSGIYDDASPTAITLSGVSNVACTFSAGAFTGILTDSIFSSYAGFDSVNDVPSIAGTTTVNFASGNLQRITGSNATTLGDWTFPTPGNYQITIVSTVTVIGQTTANAKEMGSQAYTFPAGKDHILNITWDGTTARWSGIPEV